MRALLEHQQLVVLASGGVGKTTLSAVFGLLGAKRGKRVLVVTIDPARRLAEALGLRRLAFKPAPVSPKKLEALGLEPGCSLDIMMLDTQKAWVDLVQRLGSSKESKAKILDNRFFKFLSEDLAGSHEFVAAEKLYQLMTEANYDLVILDTPPSQNALEFLNAPSKMTEFLSEDVLRFFMNPKKSLLGKFSFGLFDRATSFLHFALTRFTNTEFLEELNGFVHLMADLYTPVITRVSKLLELFASESCAFVVVACLKEQSLREAADLEKELKTRGFKCLGVLYNQATPEFGGAREALECLNPKLIAEDRRKILNLLDFHEANVAYEMRQKLVSLGEIPVFLPEQAGGSVLGKIVCHIEESFDH